MRVPNVDPDDTIVHLIRHAWPDPGDADPKTLYGNEDMPLTGTGQMMAQLVADAFAGHDIAEIRSSPVMRARETAQPLGEATGLQVITDHDLREAENKFTGKKLAQVLTNPRDLWEIGRHPQDGWYHETFAEIAARMQNVIARAKNEHPGQEVACFTHVVAIVLALRAEEKRMLLHNPGARGITLASVSSLVYGPDGNLKKVLYAEPAGHLLQKHHRPSERAAYRRTTEGLGKVLRNREPSDPRALRGSEIRWVPGSGPSFR